MKKSNNDRYLTMTLASVLLLVGSPSYSLGIGDMKLKSMLNQNLQAEISLLLSDGESGNDLTVDLADNAKFDEAGIPWTLFLSKIKFQIVTQNAKTFIKLSSTEVLKDPFLDFLIEVKSTKGSIYREFTALIDPPSVYQEANYSLNTLALTSNEPQHFVTVPTRQTSNTTVYGPTRKNEALWHIASLFNKQNNVSLHQMIAAIFSANPDAFLANKSRLLMAGKMLKIPSFVESPELFAASIEQEISRVSRAKKKIVADSILVNPLASAATKSNSSEKTTNKKLADDVQQRLVELENQLSAMQKAIADKDQQMAVLKSVAKIAPVDPTSPVIVQPLVTMMSPIALVIDPQQPIATTVPVLPPAPAIVASTISFVDPNYFGISTDLYYYGVGGIASLLLAALGWLRLRERNKKLNEKQF